jgi:hypothetical protein
MAVTPDSPKVKSFDDPRANDLHFLQIIGAHNQRLLSGIIGCAIENSENHLL